MILGKQDGRSAMRMAEISKEIGLRLVEECSLAEALSILSTTTGVVLHSAAGLKEPPNDFVGRVAASVRAATDASIEEFGRKEKE